MASAFEVLALAKQSFLDNVPTAYLSQSSAQSVASGSTFSTAIQFTTESEDNWLGHSNVTNNTRYTAQVAGLYLCTGQVTYTNSSGLLVRAVAITKTGVQVAGSQAYNQSYSNNFTSVTTTVAVRLGVGDYLELFTWQNSGAALNTVTAGTSMTIAYLHA